MLITTKVMAACIVLSLIGVPTLSFAKARGGSGGGFSSGSRSGGSGSMGSRGSRTYQQNGAKPIEQSTTAKPAAPPPQMATPSPASQSAPAAPASWWQRNPVMTGLIGGIAGSWIGHMIFGATDSNARSGEAGEQNGEPGQAAGAAGLNGMLLLLLMLMGGGVLYYVLKGRRETTTPAFSGIARAGVVSGSLLDSSSIRSVSADQAEVDVTSADKAAFQQMLIDIQTAWGRQDLSRLRGLVTPEILDYFSVALAEQTSQDIANHVEDVTLLRAEVREAWTEGTTQYTTVLLHWRARDYTVSLTKPRGDSGYLIEGSDEQPTETTEIWTFMRHQNGKWLLSAIQQIA